MHVGRGAETEPPLQMNMAESVPEYLRTVR